MANILVCDDESDIVSALRIYLQAEGYRVYEAYNGLEALQKIEQYEIHLVLMDIMMPQMDGINAMARIRETSNIPVILLTAKGEETDKVLGLMVGADDYVTKPFHPVELIARVKAQLRRYMSLGGARKTEVLLVYGGICLDDNAKTVTIDAESVSLTPTEYEILKLLMQHPGKVFSSAEIYGKVWNDTIIGAEGTVSVHIRHLREKIEINPAEPRYIKVVWGQGYKFQEVIHEKS